MRNGNTKTLKIIDSHTAGEPTRVVIEGFPDLGDGALKEKLARFDSEFDYLRNAIVNEPRGHSAIVGALLFDPLKSANDAGVIFFNNVGFLNMCGHGTIGLVKTLEFLGRTTQNGLKIETPAGLVSAKIEDDGSVTIENVASFRFRKDVNVKVAGYGEITGDIAFGGNWFFLVNDTRIKIELGSLSELLKFSTSIRNALERENICGAEGAVIDHIEIFGETSTANSRNFVLCPGLEFDRSPCGTGTSAKIACLLEDGKITEGETWVQESIIGSRFRASAHTVNGNIIPQINGSAYITGEANLIFDKDDPLRLGIV
ncbi:MAG: proline racemase family protein [Pyrinomonadaceae bacterium]